MARQVCEAAHGRSGANAVMRLCLARMKIAIIGAGAIGGFFAARLALAGHNVSVLARSVNILRARHGPPVRSILGAKT